MTRRQQLNNWHNRVSARLFLEESRILAILDDHSNTADSGVMAPPRDIGASYSSTPRVVATRGAKKAQVNL